jgi:hypothetical protein
MTDKVLCKDCKHSFRKFSDWLWHGESSFAYSCRKSFRPTHDEPDLVLGSKKVPAKYESCGIARISNPNLDYRCGEEGKFWQPKNKKDLFKFIRHVSI